MRAGGLHWIIALQNNQSFTHQNFWETILWSLVFHLMKGNGIVRYTSNRTLSDSHKSKLKFIFCTCWLGMCKNGHVCVKMCGLWNPKTCLTCVCNRADVSQGLAELRKWPKLLHNRAVKLFLKHSQKHSFHKTCTLKLATVAPRTERVATYVT